jgi:TRAP-type C4-dicarboxylate transport system substrate-binding protein
MAPFAQHTPEQMIVIDRNMRKRVPAMNEVYLKHNQVFLVSGPSPGMDLFATFPIRTVDDLKGRKIGASGSFGQWFRGTSGVVVTSAMIESYTSIKNGVYEGYPISIGLAYPFKTYQVAPYYTEINFGTQPTSGVTVHTGTWNGFPDFVKDIFREAAEMWPKWSIETDTARETMFRERMEKEGVKFYTMPLSERRRWTMMMPNIAQQWAASVEEKGFPARAVLTAFMDELRALKVEIPRQWDRE